MKKTLFPPQENLVRHLTKVLSRRSSAINTSDTGTGKTLMSVEMSRNLGWKPLVVCPKAVITPWRRAFADQGYELPLDVINYEKLRTGKTPYGQWENKKSKKFLWNPGVREIIWDEAHKCKATTSQNAWMMMAAQDRKNLLLSATLAENPSEMKAAGFLLGLHQFKNWIIWAKSLGCYFDPWGKLQFTTSPARARENLTRLNEFLYPDCGGKLTRDDMAEFFSITSIATDPLDFGDNGQISKLYSEVESFMKEIEAKELNDTVNPAAEALVKTLRARQKVEMLKLPLIADLVKEAWSEGHSVAVFLNFNDSIVALDTLLGGKCPIVWGTDPRSGRSQTADERQASIDKFQRNEQNIILLNVQAGGVAISLHDETGGHPRLALISPTWNAKDLHQTLGRVDRAGAKSNTVQRVLFAAETIEEDVRTALERKLLNLRSLHDHSTAISPSTQAPIMPVKKVAPITTPAPEPKTPATKASKSKGTKKQSAETGDHAFFSPSSLGYYEVCPSYLNREDSEEERNDPDNPSNRGTRMHLACEQEDPHMLERDDEQHIVSLVLQEVYDIRDWYGFQKSEVFREVRLPIKTPHVSTFGTVDRVHILGDEALVFDYKFGWMPVSDADVNAQAAAYVAGVFQKWPDVRRVRFFFLAPMVNTVSGATFVRHESLWDELDYEPDETRAVTYDELIQRVDLVVERAVEQHGKVFSPQVHMCEFCGNKLHCKPLWEKALLLARVKPEDGLQLPKTLDPANIDDPDTMSKLRLAIVPLEKLIEEVKARANWLAFDQGYDIPGFTKTYRKTSRTVTNALGAFTVTAEKFGVTHDEFLSCIKTVPLGDLEEVVGSKAPHGQKARFKDQLDLALRQAEVLSGGDTEFGALKIDRKQNK